MGLKDMVKALVTKSVDFTGFWNDVNTDEGEKLPVHPEWFFTARLGQPRKINVFEVRTFAKSAWVQMVLNTIKKEISIIPYECVNSDPKDLTDYVEEKEKVNDFFNNINTDKQSLKDIMSEVITDIGEIDAGVWAKVFTVDSYQVVVVDVMDEYGRKAGTREERQLKPFGQRELAQLRSADGSTFLKRIDIFKRLLAYYQYSFKYPRTNPLLFEPDEIAYMMMNKRTQSIYGFSPVQAVQQVIEILTQSTRWNKEFYQKNAIPDGIVSILDAEPGSLKRFQKQWERRIKGKAHRLLFQNTDAKFTPFSPLGKDMEWLEGQKWYFHLVFGVFGVSPAEAGFHEDVNRSSQEGQERVTVKNAIKPYLQIFEDTLNRNIIPELLQDERPVIKIRFLPKDHSQEQIEFMQHMSELDQGAMTINEYRTLKGQENVAWGDVPFNQLSAGFGGLPGEDDTQVEVDDEKGGKKTVGYTKAMRRFLDGRNSNT